MNAVFQALSDPTRREILRLLRKRAMTAGEIADRFPLARSTLSGHFNILKNAGLIVAEKNGTSILYSLNVSVVEADDGRRHGSVRRRQAAKKGKVMKLSWRVELVQLAIIGGECSPWPRGPGRKCPTACPCTGICRARSIGYGGKFVGLLLLPLGYARHCTCC